MRKTRPAVVVSTDAIGVLPLKVVVPITDWKDRYAGPRPQVRIGPAVSPLPADLTSQPDSP
ncbi:type II toxin-antitoxin system PemK/MazF family toxin [candidate division WOR-3 bacterium]|nr:type II toxin-antitoxin system PemK/MazF family toxin [candidate division WOR-3 bacterium]